MTKKPSQIPSHTMELPRLIVIGEKNIGKIGNFLLSLDHPKKVSIVTGKHVKKLL
jgi:glycerol-1-phosphate dehydrogenase [NAD(P)+]